MFRLFLQSILVYGARRLKLREKGMGENEKMRVIIQDSQLRAPSKFAKTCTIERRSCGQICNERSIGIRGVSYHAISCSLSTVGTNHCSPSFSMNKTRISWPQFSRHKSNIVGKSGADRADTLGVVAHFGQPKIKKQTPSANETR
jgi:hypothetical protein